MRTIALILLTSAASAQIKIAVNATTIESAPVFLADRIPGVEIIPVPNGRAAMAQLLSGTADAATGSETQALLNSTAEPGIRIILTLAEARYRVVARRSAGIHRIEDLRSKKVAATINTSSQYFLREMLRTAGLHESDVHFVNLEGPEMPSALKRGDVDAVAIWEPHAQNSLEALGKDAVVLQNASAYKERFNLNTTTKALSDPDKRRALVNFVRAAILASERVRREPGPARVSLAPFIGAQTGVIERVWNQFRFPANLAADLPTVIGQVEVFVAAIQNRPPRIQTALIDSSVLAEARR
jgi:sulfonate transport system substrate-binding protein